jgi:hypothetical protein
MTLTPLQQAWLHAKRGEPYTPPKPTPEQLREDCKKAIWNAQRGIWRAKRILDHANSNEQRERALKAVRWWEEVLQYSKKKLDEMDKP